MIKAQVSENQAGKRLDVFVVEQIPELSRAFAGTLIKDGRVLLNGEVSKPGEKLRSGEVVTIDYDLKELEQIPSIKLPIIYEDDDCIIIDKPAGVLTHSKGRFNPEATIATFIAERIKDTTLLGDRAGIVHRLDRTTSGIIICAKTHESLAWLQKQFSQRRVKKTYIAIVEGHVEPKEAVIDIPIERNAKDPKSFKTASGGKTALTHYKVQKSVGKYDLLELHPETGRTHQLRVHMRHIGHPIVGDTLYKGQSAERLYLHALALEITLPSRERKTFIASLPKQFGKFLESSSD